MTETLKSLRNRETEFLEDYSIKRMPWEKNTIEGNTEKFNRVNYINV